MAMLLGKKIGMTQIFDERGIATAVTAISAGPCVILGVTNKNIRLGYEDIAEKKTKNPQVGMFKKLNITPKRVIKEIENKPHDPEIKVGQE